MEERGEGCWKVRLEMQGGHVLGDLKVILRSSSIRKHSPHLPTWETRVNGRIAGGAKVCEPQAG